MATLTKVDFDPFAPAADDAARTPRLTKVDFDPFAPAQVGTGEDIAKGAGSGLVRGTANIPGGPGSLIELLKRVGDWANQKQVEYGLAKPEDIERFKANREVNAKTPITGQDILDRTGIEDQLYKPQTKYGQAAENIASFLPGAATGGSISNLAKFGLVPGLLSEGAGQVADRVAPDYAPAARFLGGLLGPKAAHPHEVKDAGVPEFREQHLANVDALREAGIPVTAGEALNNLKKQYTENTLDPERGTAALSALTRHATGIISGRDGEPILQPGAGGTLDRIYRDLGGRFRQFENYDLQFDPQMAQDIIAHRTEVNRNPGLNPEAERAANSIFTRLNDTLVNRGGVMPGEDFRALRSDIAREARGSGENATRGDYLNEINSILDDAMARQIGRQGGDEAGFRQLNRDYKNYLVLEKAAGMAGKTANQGLLTPAALASAIKSTYSKRDYLLGRDDLSGVVQPANAVLKNLPDSGTAWRKEALERTEKWAKAIMGLGGAAAGGGLGALTGHHFMGDAGAGAGAVGGGTEGRVLGLLAGEVASPLIAEGVHRARQAYHLNPAVQAWQEGRFMRDADGRLSIPGLLSAAQAAQNGR